MQVPTELLSPSHLFLAALGILSIWVAKAFAFAARRKLPPGPARRWLVGNFFDLPRTLDLQRFASWHRTYGDVVYVEAFGFSILLLGSSESINDLLEKRGTIYSHRPQFVMSAELLGLKKSLALYDYDARYIELKKPISQAMSRNAAAKYVPIQERIVFDYLVGLLDGPDDFLDNLWYSIGRAILAITYGIPIDPHMSEYITDAEAAMATVSKTLRPGAYWVDLFPALRHLEPFLPFLGWVQEGRAGRAVIERLVNRPYEVVKANIATGSAPLSFLSETLSDQGRLANSKYDLEDGLKWAAGSMYGAGVETSYVVVSTFFLLMTFHVEAQVKAQMEIDRVVGSDRLVEISDRSSLPYVCALVKEVMRWHVPTPLSVFRRTKVDDEYRGYHIPSGTIVMPNIWYITVFKPERFLEDTPPRDPSDYIFGYGRRTCPGKHLAENSAFLFIANILARFNIRPLEKEFGGLSGIDDASFRPYLVRVPERFKCKITPRGSVYADWLSQAASEMPPFDSAFVHATRQRHNEI